MSGNAEEVLIALLFKRAEHENFARSAPFVCEQCGDELPPRDVEAGETVCRECCGEAHG